MNLGQILKTFIRFYMLDSSFINCRLFKVCFHLILNEENPPECTAGAAEGRGASSGKPLRHGHDQRLCRKGAVCFLCISVKNNKICVGSTVWVLEFLWKSDEFCLT